jgi:nucleotide-binding universal stress UspA family protein
MKLIKKILAPVDFTEHSRRGLVYALSLAAERDAEVVVLHVAGEIRPWEFYSDEPELFVDRPEPWTADRTLQEILLDLGHFLEAIPVSADRPVKIKKKAALGAVVAKIIETARREEADLIVMGKKRKSALHRFFSPSISEAVGREAPCPVLSIGEAGSHRAGRGTLVRATRGLVSVPEA